MKLGMRFCPSIMVFLFLLTSSAVSYTHLAYGFWCIVFILLSWLKIIKINTITHVLQETFSLLEMDYEKTKSFLEYMSNGIEVDNFEPTQQNEDLSLIHI